jgi:hypothetical protein
MNSSSSFAPFREKMQSAGLSKAAIAANRGRIGLRTDGHHEALRAISTVFALASGRSLNSSTISARDLK